MLKKNHKHSVKSHLFLVTDPRPPRYVPAGSSGEYLTPFCEDSCNPMEKFLSEYAPEVETFD